VFLQSTLLAAERAEKGGYTDGGYGTEESPYTGDVLQVSAC
jgi:hypothetical protein